MLECQIFIQDRKIRVDTQFNRRSILKVITVLRPRDRSIGTNFGLNEHAQSQPLRLPDKIPVGGSGLQGQPNKFESWNLCERI